MVIPLYLPPGQLRLCVEPWESLPISRQLIITRPNYCIMNVIFIIPIHLLSWHLCTTYFFRKQHTKILNQTGDHFLSSSGQIFSMHLNIRHRQSLWGSGTIVRSHQIFLSKFTLDSFSLVSSFTKIWQKQRLCLSFPNQLGKASQINLQMFHCVYWVVIYFIY